MGQRRFATRACSLLVLVSACSSGSGSPDAGGGSGSSTGGGVTCHTPAESPCASQADCSDSRAYNILLHACVEAGGTTECVYQAPLGPPPTCSPIEPAVACQVNVSQATAGSLRSVFLRAYYPGTTDGSPISCASIEAEAGAFTDGGAAEDVDPKLNLAYWGGFPIASGSGDSSFLFSASLAAGPNRTLYLEAYSGGLDETSQLPTGQRLGTACLDAQSVASDTTSEQMLAFTIQ